MHTPGHSPGNISLYLPGERLVIAGDVPSNTYGLSLPSKAFTVNLVQEINSIKRLGTLEFDMVCFGHGLPLKHNPR